MAKRTQKAGATARFGARYGVSVRRNACAALATKPAKYTFPLCHYRTLATRLAELPQFRSTLSTCAGGAWEPFTRASDTNSRILRRSVEGATTADMAFIAQQAALDYERALAAGEITEEE